jgi:hydrophobe/amphiphile efflux-1 (HAE1) family protein
MRFSRFFIDRPIFAGVISVIIVLIGLFAYPNLPIAQYPPIAPPTVTVTAVYPGASAEVVADTVATPLEQEINGVENMLYMSSSSTGDGRLTITITFGLGTDLDIAQVLVQNRVAAAEPRLPEEVRRLGITTRKATPDFLMVIHLLSPDGSLDQGYVSNYATLNVRDRIARLEGVGSALIFGGRDYSMRIWIDPERAAARNMTAGEIVGALRARNVQVAAGTVGAPPFDQGGSAFELNVQTLGRLSDPAQFENVVLKTDEQGRPTRLSDVARVELGAQDYTINAYLNNQSAVALGIAQMPGSNALATSDRVIATMEELEKDFPPGLQYDIIYNPTDYVRASIDAVRVTLIEAIALVTLVVLIFLQTWRASLIPILAIPVSLIGTFAVMAAFGFSLNNLSLFGLVLAIGIVVDDAIVVVENVERKLSEGIPPKEAAYQTMDEVGTALISIALVLAAVFVPTAFISGISGQFYQQFALTITAATLISCLVSLTLSPALAALILRPHAEHHDCSKIPWWQVPLKRFANGFNRGFAWLEQKYGKTTCRVIRKPLPALMVYAALIGLTVWRFEATPSGFIPAQDQGYFIGVVQLPPGSSLERTDAVIRQVWDIAKDVPGVINGAAFTGLDGATFTNAPNAGTIFFDLADFDERTERGLKADDILNELRMKLGAVDQGFVLVIPPPPVQGIGTGGGFKMVVQDRAGAGYKALEGAATEIMMAGNQEPGLSSVFTLFNTGTPRIYADIDRDKAEMMGVPPERVFETLGIYLGSAFVNDFNLLGRTYRVTAQADAAFRNDRADIVNLKTRSNSGQMVPIGSVANLRDESGPYRVVRYNLYPAAEVQGDRLPDFSSGQALDAMERIASEKLPEGMGFEWTELAFQERATGNTAMLTFGLAVIFVFLLLAAQYESLTLPLAIILIVPMCLLAAILGINIRGMDNNILSQIGLVVLVGLAAKNAILIVEFAKQGEDRGLSLYDAVAEAARLRLRPILMTSLAFIFGVVPLVIATGPGAEMRQALGTVVFFGMIGVTIFGLIFTPVFYMLTRTLADRAARLWRRRPPAVQEPLPQPAE